MKYKMVQAKGLFTIEETGGLENEEPTFGTHWEDIRCTKPTTTTSFDGNSSLSQLRVEALPINQKLQGYRALTRLCLVLIHAHQSGPQYTPLHRFSTTVIREILGCSMATKRHFLRHLSRL